MLDTDCLLVASVWLQLQDRLKFAVLRRLRRWPRLHLHGV